MGRYDDLNRTQLIELLEKRDRERKLGLVWERDEIEADQAIDQNFIVARIDEAASDLNAPWSNLIIEGDNYDALRWLRMTHRGQVKCIYIDPPYNTGNKDWVYNDRYMSAEDRFLQSTWLEFMFRRLELARDLLADDGAIFVSINDQNRSLLELLMEQVLPGKRLGSLVWRTRDTTSAKDRNFSDVHEHVLVFAGAEFSFKGAQKSNAKYKNPDKDPRGNWNSDPLTLAFDSLERPNLFYPLHDPELDIWYPCDPDRVWAYASKKNLKHGQKTQALPMEEQINERRIVWPIGQQVQLWSSLQEVREAVDSGEVPLTPRDKKPLITADSDLEFWVGKRVGFGRPAYKKFWSNLRSKVSPLGSWIARMNELDMEDVQTLRSSAGGVGTNEIQALFGRKAFPFPKPSGLIKQIIDQSTTSDDLVLDFFAGSGTAAQAVMELNDEDQGARRFILVSSTEATADEPDKNICRQVTAERVRKLNASEDKKYAELKAGFAYLKTHEIDFADFDYEAKSSDAWTALEAMHGLPLTKYDDTQPWNIHEAEAQTLVLVDQFEPHLLDWLQANERQNLHVYAWAPGQITQRMEGFHVSVLPVRETLVRAFRA